MGHFVQQPLFSTKDVHVLYLVYQCILNLRPPLSVVHWPQVPPQYCGGMSTPSYPPAFLLFNNLFSLLYTLSPFEQPICARVVRWI
jgi:hypothetical protein